jgi:hypothetical protein
VYSKVIVLITLQVSLIITFSEAGWVGRDAILMTGINSLIYILSTLPPYDFVSPRLAVELKTTQMDSCRPLGTEGNSFVWRCRGLYTTLVP